jgi:hypothetical protein
MAARTLTRWRKFSTCYYTKPGEPLLAEIIFKRGEAVFTCKCGFTLSLNTHSPGIYSGVTCVCDRIYRIRTIIEVKEEQ